MFTTHTLPHALNILVHLVCGTAALCFGLIAILSRKGGKVHIRSGRFFIYVYGIVVTTAGIGLAVFNFRPFLAVVTMLSLYDVFSGYRALQLRGKRPQLMDSATSAFAIVTPWIFISIMRRFHQPWSPVLTWSILGTLVLISGYDLLRNIISAAWLKKVWMQEHLMKMMSAYIAITSAFAGTVFPRFMPWPAVLPSLVGTAVSVGFLLAGPRIWLRRERAPSLQHTPISLDA